MRTFFVSRHEGAKKWAKSQGLAINFFVEHLEISEISAKDKVIGNLPVHLAAEVCKLGARYFHLVLHQQEDTRGINLSQQQMEQFSAEIVEFQITKSE